MKSDAHRHALAGDTRQILEHVVDPDRGIGRRIDVREYRHQSVTGILDDTSPAHLDFLPHSLDRLFDEPERHGVASALI